MESNWDVLGLGSSDSNEMHAVWGQGIADNIACQRPFISSWKPSMNTGEIVSISNDAELEASIARISDLMKANPKFGTPEGDELARLAKLVEAYEDTHSPIDPPSPSEAAKFRLEQTKGQGSLR